MGMSLVFLLVGLAVGALLGYAGAVARRASTPDQAGTLRAEVARWQARAEERSRRVESAEARSQGDASVLQALAPVRAQLELMTQRVDQMEQIRARQHGALAEQLRESARRETELARTTASLEGALRSRSARGTWGEVELARILEASGMMPHVDFAEQRSIGSLTQGRGRGGVTSSGDLGRPDVTIHLPGQGFLALDAKAPMDAYLRACAIEESGEDAESRRRAELSTHAKALRSHVDALAGRDYAQSLGAYDPNARPMALSFRRLALAALVESAGKVIVDPSSRDILIPRSATSALAQGDHWLPAWKDQELRDLLFRQAQDECSSIIDLSVEYAGMGVCRVSLVIDPQAVEEADRAQLRERVLHAIDVLNSNKRLRAVADDIQWVPRWGTVAG